MIKLTDIKWEHTSYVWDMDNYISMISTKHNKLHTCYKMATLMEWEVQIQGKKHTSWVSKGYKIICELRLVSYTPSIIWDKKC